MWNWFNFGFGSQPIPNVGGPLPPIAFPCLSMTWAYGWMLPSAASTVGTSRTTSTRDAGTLARTSLPKLPLITFADRTAASVPRLMFANRSSNVFWIVAVSTSVPEMNETPSTTASAVNKNRSLWPASPLRVTFHMGYSPPSLRIFPSTASAVGSPSSSTM